MAPGDLVVSAYVGCPDITQVGGEGVNEGRGPVECLENMDNICQDSRACICF